MLFLNFKAYSEGTGPAATAMAKVLESVVQETGIKIIPAVSATDIKEIASQTTLEVWSQKIDPFEPGAHTGAILAEAVFEDGAMGTFLNHSEAKFASFETLAIAYDRAKAVGLKTLIFAKDLEELKNVCSLSPNFVSYEPPEFIGSATTSVSQAQPDIIKNAADIARVAGLPLVVGAGIHSQDDVRKSLELGAAGVVLASDVMKAEDPRRELMDLVEGFK